jgi:hypothetical protein
MEDRREPKQEFNADPTVSATDLPTEKPDDTALEAKN